MSSPDVVSSLYRTAVGSYGPAESRDKRVVSRKHCRSRFGFAFAIYARRPRILKASKRVFPLFIDGPLLLHDHPPFRGYTVFTYFYTRYHFEARARQKTSFYFSESVTAGPPF